MSKELLFKVTAKDCNWQYFRGSGPGGQKKNKTHNAVRCTHRASGAVGVCTEHREQSRNKKIAFKRMAETPEFKAWHKLEVSRRTGEAGRVEQAVAAHLQPKNLRIEGKDERGRWSEEAYHGGNGE